MYNTDKFVYFVSKRQYGAPYGFTSYTDENGELRMIAQKKDKNGDIIPRRFNFGRRDRTMRIPKNQKDILGNSVVEFLRNHPECKNSPNNLGITLFEEINEDASANLAIKAKSARIDAEQKALTLEGEDLIDMCALIGQFGSKESVLKHKILDYAGNEPDKFLELYDAPDRKTRSLIRQGLIAGVLDKKGNMISWETTVIGVDEDSAVTTIGKDKKLANALEQAIKRVK